MESEQERQEPQALKKGDLVARGFRAWGAGLDPKYGFGLVLSAEKPTVHNENSVEVFWQKIKEKELVRPVELRYISQNELEGQQARYVHQDLKLGAYLDKI